MIEALNRQHTKGNLFHVTIEVGVPGKQVMVDRNSGRNQAHEDVYVALRDAFNAARRRLEDHSRKRAGRVKSHEVTPHGKIARLTGIEDYGVITTFDGGEIYLHKHNPGAATFDNVVEEQKER